MRREECEDVLKRIPELSLNQIVFVLRNQSILALDNLARFEPLYLVFRGREVGGLDEGRGFFVPYEEIAFIKLERIVKIGELKQMYGEQVTGREAAELADAGVAAPAQPSAADPKSLPTPGNSPTTADPATIAKNNLLERIRATRANVAGATGKLGPK